MYVDNRNYPGGPWAYFLATQNITIDLLFYSSLCILTFLSDILVLWRCWVIWTASGRVTTCIVTFFPALLLLASVAVGTLWTLESSHPGLYIHRKLPQAYGTAYYVISLSINITLTILIMIRLFMYRRSILRVLPEEHGRDYVSLATIVVESAALYSVFALIFVITFATNNPLSQIFLSIASAAQQIAGYLIIFRLADGRAWNKNTLSTQALPSINFRPVPNHPTTQLNSFNVISRTGPISPPPPALATDAKSTLVTSQRKDSLLRRGGLFYSTSASTTAS